MARDLDYSQPCKGIQALVAADGSCLRCGCDQGEACPIPTPRERKMIADAWRGYQAAAHETPPRPPEEARELVRQAVYMAIASAVPRVSGPGIKAELVDAVVDAALTAASEARLSEESDNVRTAAPDMLEALMAAELVLSHGGVHEGSLVLLGIRAAIAKAVTP